MASVDDKMYYVGSAPVEGIDQEHTEHAFQMLILKLSKIQKKTIDRIVEKKHGTRLSEASPVYQKVAKKLRDKGLDCTMGDKVNVKLSRDELEISEHGGDTTSLMTSKIMDHQVLEAPDTGRKSLIVVYGNRSEPTLHAIAGELAQVETLKLKLSLLMQSITPDGSTDKVMFGASSGGWAASAPIHFGVGFNRKASEKRPMGLRRKATINLKGSHTAGEVKRRSDAYGGAMFGFGSMPPPGAAGAAAVPAEISEGDVDSLHLDDDEDDDLLAGASADLYRSFEQDDAE